MYFLFLSCNIMSYAVTQLRSYAVTQLQSYAVTKLRSSTIVFAFNIFEKKYKQTL